LTNFYKKGFPTLNPLNADDVLRYNKANYILKDLVEQILNNRLK